MRNHVQKREIKQLRLKTSMVFQNYNIFKNKTVLENVMLPMIAVQKMEKEKKKKKRRCNCWNRLSCWIRLMNILPDCREVSSKELE